MSLSLGNLRLDYVFKRMGRSAGKSGASSGVRAGMKSAVVDHWVAWCDAWGQGEHGNWV